MRIRRLIIPSLCWALIALGGFSLSAAILIFLGVVQGGVQIGIVYGVVGLPLLTAALILSRWSDKRRATEEDGRGFDVLPLPPARRECSGTETGTGAISSPIGDRDAVNLSRRKAAVD